jgi:hypothetical protein
MIRLKIDKDEEARSCRNSEAQKEKTGEVKKVEQTGPSCPAASQHMRQFFMPYEKSGMPGI